MQCLNPRRRYGGFYNLEELLADATVYLIKGRNAMTKEAIYGTQSAFAPASGTVYFFSICDGYFGVWKIVDRVVTSTAIFRSSISNNGFYKYDSGTTHRYYFKSDGYSAGSTAPGNLDGIKQNGCTIATVQFSAPEATVDAAIKHIKATRLDGNNTTSNTTGSTSDTTNKLILVAKSDGIAFYNKSRTLVLASNNPATVSGDSISVSGYGYSLIGLK